MSNFNKSCEISVDLINELLDFIEFKSSNALNVKDLMNWDGEMVQIIENKKYFSSTNTKPSCWDSLGKIYLMNVLEYEELASFHSFKEYSDFIYRSNEEVHKTVSSLCFEIVLLALVRTLKYEKRKCVVEDLKNIFDIILTQPLKEYAIIHKVNKADMAEEKTHYGDFNFYNLALPNEDFKNIYQDFDESSVQFKNDKKIIVETKVSAREPFKSLQIAETLFAKFEFTFCYTTSDLSNKHSLEIETYGNDQYSVVFENNKKTAGYTKVPDYNFMNLNDPIFKTVDYGYNKIWGLITKKNKNNIEKQISIAIEWIGKGVAERDTAKAFIQFIFAIEALLQFRNDQMVNPSITSQISDWAAFITEDTYEKRKAIADDFKKLYAVRSKIAHGTSADIKLVELGTAFRLAKAITTSFLVKKPFCEMKSKEEINEYINKLKFK